MNSRTSLSGDWILGAVSGLLVLLCCRACSVQPEPVHPPGDAPPGGADSADVKRVLDRVRDHYASLGAVTATATESTPFVSEGKEQKKERSVSVLIARPNRVVIRE